MRALAIFAINILLGVSAGSQFAAALDCSQVCGSNSPECLELSDLSSEDTSASIPSGIATLYDKLSDVDVDQIKKEDMLRYFGLDSDNCNRSDTVITTLPPQSGDTSDQHKLFNSGTRCLVSGSVVLPSGRRMTAGIVVPEILDVKFQKNQDEILMIPRDRKSPPLVYFSIKSFQLDFGGPISKLLFRRSETFIELPTSCIWVKHGQ